METPEVPKVEIPNINEEGESGIDLAGLKKISKQRRKTIFVNEEVRPVEATIDERRGIVTFRDPVGHLAVTTIQAREQGRIRYPPWVSITFAYEDSKRAREAYAQISHISRGYDLPTPRDTDVQYFYSYLASRDKSGKIVHLNPDLVDPEQTQQIYPMVIEDDSFEMFVRLDGKSNKEELDKKAHDIAKEHLDAPQDVQGEEGLVHDLLDIQCSSVISQVTWTVAPGVAQTEWSINDVSKEKRKRLLLGSNPGGGRITTRATGGGIIGGVRYPDERPGGIFTGKVK